MNKTNHVRITTEIPLGLSVTLNSAPMLFNFQISYSDLLIMHEMQVLSINDEQWRGLQKLPNFVMPVTLTFAPMLEKK